MVTKRCALPGCPNSFEAKTARAKWCSNRCRRRAQKVAVITALPVDAGSVDVLVSVFKATLAELDAVGRTGSAAGQSALQLAARLDRVTADTGSSIAALAREHRQALESALAGATKAGDPFDELAARRSLRVAGA